MKHSPIKVANWFIKKYKKMNIVVHPLQIMHLILIADGFHTGYFNESLMNENMRISKIVPFYESYFKKTQNKQIAKRIYFYIDMFKLPFSTVQKGLLEAIWDNYGGFNLDQLKHTLTRPGTPYHTAISLKLTHTIPSELIKTYYNHLIEEVSDNDQIKIQPEVVDFLSKF